MKTTWNVIKSKTNRLQGRTVGNYENSPETFNGHSLSIAEKMSHSIRHSDTEGTSDNRNPMYCLSNISHNPLPIKHHGLSPRANYTDRATAACQRSDCQLLRIEGATWSAWRIPMAVFSVF
jgi:hypothetical protein